MEDRHSRNICEGTVTNTAVISTVPTVVMLSLGWAAHIFENEIMGLHTHDKCVIHELFGGTWLIWSFVVSVCQHVNPLLLALS